MWDLSLLLLCPAMRDFGSLNWLRPLHVTFVALVGRQRYVESLYLPLHETLIVSVSRPS